MKDIEYLLEDELQAYNTARLNRHMMPGADLIVMLIDRLVEARKEIERLRIAAGEDWPINHEFMNRISELVREGYLPHEAIDKIHAEDNDDD